MIRARYRRIPNPAGLMAGDDEDLPIRVDFRDAVTARAWIEDTRIRRPWRPRFFDAFCSALIDRRNPPPTPKLKAIMKEQEKCVQRIVSGGKAHEDELPSYDVMVQEIENLRDRMCACRNKECAHDAAEALADWGKQYQSTFDKQPADARAKALAAAEAQNKCYDKLMAK